MNQEYYSKVDIYNLFYTDSPSEFEYKIATSQNNKEERYITNVKINGSQMVDDEEEYNTFLEYCLTEAKSVSSRTMCIDYRLLTDKAIEIIEKAYKDGNITGIRLYPDEAVLTKQIIDKFDKPSFKGFLLVANNIEDNNNENLDIRCEENVCAIEKIRFKDNGPVEDKIHITRKLDSSEIHSLAEIIKKNNYNEILVDFYEPMYYKKLLEALRDENISSNIRIKLLANPLYDESFIYEELNDVIDNPVVIQYNTCNDLNEYYMEEPTTACARYYSDIEASGITTTENYASMVKMFDEVITHIEEKEYSPLEKVAYIHDYFKKHYTYNDRSNCDIQGQDRDLDKVYDKNKMICEGFSNLYSALLRRTGILCFTYGTDDHQKNIIRLKDDKYGIDNLALIDPTWDLDNYNNRNIFSHFLVPLDNDLYAVDPEVISIPTALTIDNETYTSNIELSNPVYATDALGYAIRMLQLMGLGDNSKHFNTREEEADYYKSALANSTLKDKIPAEKIEEAVFHVRREEHDYSDEFDEDYDHKLIHDNIITRGNPHSVEPRIRLLDRFARTEINTNYYEAVSDEHFTDIGDQYTRYYRPRKKLEEEQEEQYNRYLEDFYHNMFYKNKVDNRVEVQYENIPRKPNEVIESIKENLVEEKEVTTNSNILTIYRENDKLYGSIEVINKLGLQVPNNSIKIDNNLVLYELNEMISYLLLNSTHKENAPFKIEYIELNLDKSESENELPEYEIVEETEQVKAEDLDDLIPGTNFKKPRGRGIYETDEEYVAYLKEYYDSIFPPKEEQKAEENTNIPRPKREDETDEEYSMYLEDYYGVIPEEELIPGTNFRKPRGRGIYETDEEYVEFLEEYYKSIFGEEVVEQSKVGKVR